MASAPRTPEGGKELSRGEGDPTCLVKNVIPTSTVFAAALERLNRQSVIHLLQQIVQEIDQHCQMFGKTTTDEVNKLRIEVLALIAALQTGTENQKSQTLIINQQIAELDARLSQYTTSFEQNVVNILGRQLDLKLPGVITEATSKVEKTVNNLVDVHINKADVKSLRVQLDQLHLTLEKIKETAAELNAHELKQVEALVLKLIANYNLSPLISTVSVKVNGRVFVLERLLDVLATVDKVEDTHIDYSATDITGARLVLTDKTVVIFVCSRRELPEARQIQYLFETQDWKGLPASFILGFERRDTEMQMCGRSVVLANYDGVFQSNIKFDLCRQAGADIVLEPAPPVSAPPRSRR